MELLYQTFSRGKTTEKLLYYFAIFVDYLKERWAKIGKGDKKQFSARSVIFFIQAPLSTGYSDLI